MYYDLKVKETRRFIVSMIMILIVVVTVHFIIQGAVSCVSQQGCIRNWCKIEWLN